MSTNDNKIEIGKALYMITNCNKKVVDDVFDLCFSCANPIRKGTAGIIIYRDIEKWMVTDEGALTIKTISSETAASICFDCGNWYSNIEQLRFLLSEELGLKKNPDLDVDVQEHEIICDGCSEIIRPDSTRVSISLCIAQIGDPNNHGSTLEVIPIRADEIYTFCDDCGTVLTAEKFEKALCNIGWLVC